MSIRLLSKRPGVRYLAIGGGVYVLEMAVIVTTQRIGASPVWAVAIGFWVGVAASFVLQKAITFSDKRLHHRVLLPQFAAFSLLVLFNFGFTILIVKLLAHLVPAVAGRSFALGVTVIWNFYLYKTRIFKTDENPVY